MNCLNCNSLSIVMTLRKRFLPLFFLLSVVGLYAQDLYVDNNSYIYVKDVPLFVQDDIRLEAADSFIYLRGNGQLLQQSDSKNSDLGELSVYQEQTTELYEYNYWCSPVGVSVDGTAQANVNFDISNTHLPADLNDDTNLNSSPFTYTGNLNSTQNVLSYAWIFTLESAEGYGGWNLIGDTGAVSPGYGFTLKGRPDPPPTIDPKIIDFRGRPNNGNMTINVNFDGVDNEPNSEPIDQASTLTGNPYPSAMDLKLFFVNSAANQANLDGNIYFWEQAAVGSHDIQDYEGGYAAYTPGDLGNLSDNGSYTVATFLTYNSDGGSTGPSGGTGDDFSTNNSRRYAAIGQGFLINSDNAAPAEINNSMRLFIPQDSNPSGNGAVFKNNDNDEPIRAMSHNGVDYFELVNNPVFIPEIRIHTRIDDTYYRENVIAFRPNSDLSYDKFSDARNGSPLKDDIFLMADAQFLNIKSINYDPTVRIPVGIKANGNNSSFSIKVFSMNHVDEDVKVYVYDKENDSYTEIINQSFDINLDEGEYLNRFEITFDNKETLSDIELNSKDFKIYQHNPTSELVILNPDNLEIQEVRLMDVNGKLIFSFNELEVNNEYRFSTQSLSDGVYLATLKFNAKNEIVKRIIVSSQN